MSRWMTMGIRQRVTPDGSRWYARENRLRRCFCATRGESDPHRIQSIAECTLAEAQLIACARRLACVEVLEAYEQGRVTFHQLWRACLHPSDEAMQRGAAGL